MAILGALLLLAGCGGKKGPKDNGVAKMSPTDAIAQVKKDVATATSVHIVGVGSTGGSPLALNLKLVKGKGGAGHITVNGLSFDIIRIADKAYFKGTSSFWSHFGGTAAAQLFKGKWLMAPANKGQLASFTPLTNITALTNQVLSTHGTLKMGETTEINGQPAVAIIDQTNGGTLYVATTGPAFPLKLVAGKGSKGAITFSEWNQPVLLTAPSKPIDYSKLTGG
jgi:hypothetical protein